MVDFYIYRHAFKAGLFGALAAAFGKIAFQGQTSHLWSWAYEVTLIKFHDLTQNRMIWRNWL